MALTPIPGYIEFFTDRDSWIVKQKTKIVLVIFAVFFVSMVMSCQELRYTISGKTIDANLTTRQVIEVREGEKWGHLVAGYNFMDGDQRRERYIDEPLDWPMAEQKSIKVQYIPGSERSRLYGESNHVWLYIFFGSLVAAVAGGIVLVKSG